MPFKNLRVFFIALLLSSCSPQIEIDDLSNTPIPSSQIIQGHTPTASATQTPLSTSITELPGVSVTQSPTETLVPSLVPSVVLNTPTIVLERSKTQAIIIDHTSIALFDHIPEEYLTAARELNLLFSDRSVGQNINEALDCLAAPSWEQSAPSCRNDYYDSEWHWKTFRLADRSSGLVPSRILFDPSPTRYNRDNWTFEFKQGGWSELTRDFIEVLAPRYVDTKDVLTYQFTYLNVTDNDDIANSERGFFADNPDRYDIYDLEAFLAQNPNMIFFFWTTSLARSIGSETALNFNNHMRLYAIENGKILFDVADIESHTDEGIPCYDNRDGMDYCSQIGQCENHPDDGKNIPAICQDYTTETEGGHLGSVSAGHIQIAKAFWVLMARIGGWNGEIKNSQ